MKGLTLLAVILISINGFAQKKGKEPESLTTQSGWVVTMGDTLKLGMGTLPNGDFKFISDKGLGAGLTNQTPWTSGSNKHNAEKNALSRNYSLSKAVVANIKKDVFFIRIIKGKLTKGYYKVIPDLAEKVGEIEKISKL